MSLDFKKMIEILLEQKPDINLEKLKELIEEKKRKIGAGYLTDQGALFLVAADLGASFDNVQRTKRGIKDLYIGARDLDLIVRLLGAYPIRSFTKKDTNEKIENRTISVYDSGGSIKVRLWDNLTHVIEENGIKPGDLIEIRNCYVKSGLNGKPILNIGEGGDIIAYGGNDTTIPDLDGITSTVDSVRAEKENAVISGIVSSIPRIIEFSDSRGERKKSLQTMLSNETGDRKLRVALWNIDEDNLPKVFQVNLPIRIIGARIKEGNPQYGNGDFEIHGDEGTVIELKESPQDYEVHSIRIISDGRSENEKVNYIGIDKNKNLVYVTLEGLKSDKMTSNSVIDCIPSRIFGNMVFLKEDSYLELVDNDSFPKIEECITKIREIQTVGNSYMVESIVLQQPNSTQVNTKNGELVSVTDTLIGDDTGEIRLVGWRDSSLELEKLKVGDRIRVMGAVLNTGREGKLELTLRKDSSISNLL
jgi:ssDNA-binding replication factor A large subunit